MQWRRSRRAVSRLHVLVWLPLSQRQLLALSTWPSSHLLALQETGQALFSTHGCGVVQLAPLSPRQIARMATMPIDTDAMSDYDSPCPPVVKVTAGCAFLQAHKERAYDA